LPIRVPAVVHPSPASSYGIKPRSTFDVVHQQAAQRVNMAKTSTNPVTAMASGCIAGAVEATFVWPMEFIKVGRMSTPIGSFTSLRLPFLIDLS
jgi:hypothetical protein